MFHPKAVEKEQSDSTSRNLKSRGLVESFKGALNKKRCPSQALCHIICSGLQVALYASQDNVHRDLCDVVTYTKKKKYN